MGQSDRADTRWLPLFLACTIFVFSSVPGILAQDGQEKGTDEETVWAQDYVVEDLDVESVRKQYGLWDLLAKSVVRRETGDIKAEVAYVNPITYVHLIDQRSDEPLDASSMKGKLEEVFDRHRLFYIVLKTEKDPGLIDPETWSVSATTVRNREVSAEKLEFSEPELTYGYTGNFYQTVIFAYFRKSSNPANDIDVLRGSSLVLEAEKLKIRQEFVWSDRDSEEQQKTYLIYHKILKIMLPILFGLLVLAIVLTRPTREWKSSGV